MTLHEFIFVLASSEATLQEKNKIKKAFRQKGIEANCIYHSAQLFKMPWTYGEGHDVTICIEFDRRYFIEMMRWIENLRAAAFKGHIILSFARETFDYGVVPKFLACGGSYIVEKKVWDLNPLFLIEHKHDTSVLGWLHNRAYERSCDIDNDAAIQHLYKELLGEGDLALESLSYVYNALSHKRKDELIDFLKTQFNVVKRGLSSQPPIEKLSKGLVTIWNHPEFCCELGIQIAKTTDKNVLIVDLDRLNPTFDFYCASPPLKKGKQTVALNEIQRLYAMNQLTDESIKAMCHPMKKLNSLHVVYGCHELKKFEYFTNEALIEALACFKRNYDIVLVNVNKFIYDAYTCISVIKSDHVLLPVSGYLTTMREYQRSIDLLCEKQQLSLEKFNYVFFECDHNFKHEMALLSDMLKSPVIGEISKCHKRRTCRNLKKNYGLTMPKRVAREYRHLIETLFV